MAMCIDASEDDSSGFRNTTLLFPQPKRNWRGQVEALTAYEGDIWVASSWGEDHYWRQKGIFSGRPETIMEFRKLQPETMQVISVVNVTDTRTRYPFGGASNACKRWFKMFGATIFAVVLLPAGFWLITIRNVPAGIVPVCTAVFVVVGSFSKELAFGVGILITVNIAIALLGPFSKKPGRETLIWTLYCTLLSVGVLDIVSGDYLVCVWTFLLLAVVGLLLDHPVLQVVGWVGGISAVLTGFLSILFGSAKFLVQNLSLITFGVIGGCGSVSTGYVLTKYRVYMRYYGRKLWHALQESSRSLSTSSAGQEGEDLTSTLLQRSD